MMDVPMNSVEPLLHIDLEASSITVVVACILLLALARHAGARGGWWAFWGFAAAALLATISLRADVALVTLGITGLVQAWFTQGSTRLGALGLALSGVGTVVAGLLHGQGAHDAVFVASVAALVIRVGPWPLHGAMARLATRAMSEQVRQLGLLLPLLFVHLRHLDHLDLAVQWSVPMVQWGAASMAVAALASIGATTLGGYYVFYSSAHGAVIIMACGAAGAGHEAAALFAGITVCVATGGQGAMVAAVRRHVGERALSTAGGLVHSMPRTAALFLVFGGAGVGLPATAAFVADDLMLHALWQESPVSTAAVIVAAALLAIATWSVTTAVFYGPDPGWSDRDLDPSERFTATACLMVMVVLGFAPRLLLDPALTILKPPPSVSVTAPDVAR